MMVSFKSFISFTIQLDLLAFLRLSHHRDVKIYRIVVVSTKFTVHRFAYNECLQEQRTCQFCDYI